MLLLHAVSELLQMHHEHLGPQSLTQQAYRRLVARVRALESPQVPWVDKLGPGSDLPNPDGPAMRAMILNVARTTLIQALVSCVAVQRRFVTGDIYGKGVQPKWKITAVASKSVRYASYRPVPETDVEALMVYIHDHEHILIAKTLETLAAARRWLTTVLPGIRQHYQDLLEQHESPHRNRAHTPDTEAT